MHPNFAPTSNVKIFPKILEPVNQYQNPLKYAYNINTMRGEVKTVSSGYWAKLLYVDGGTE